MPNTISPNMNLILPTVGQEPGPQYATDQNNSMTLIDQHDHSIGKGVQITPTGLNINTDLTFQGNNATHLRSIRFTSQLSPITAVLPDLDSIYVSGVDLYYNDGNGNQVRITAAGSVTGATGTITGLPSGTAGAAYSSISGSFIFSQATSTAATIDGGSIIIRDETVGGNGVTIAAGTSTNNYQLTLPISLPASGTSFLTVSSAGTIADVLQVDGSSIVTTGNVLQVGPLGITSSMLAANSVINGKIASSAVDGISIIVVGGVLTLNSQGAARGTDFTINTTTAAFAYSTTPTLASKTGVVRVTLMPRIDNAVSGIYLATTGPVTTAQTVLTFYQGGTIIGQTIFAMNLSSSANASYETPIGQSFIVPATVGTAFGYNVEATVTSNASGGKQTIVNGCLYVEDVTY